MSNVVVESGDGTGFVAKVASDGSIAATVTNTVGAAVTNTVDTLPAQGSVSKTEVNVATTGTQIVGPNTSRRQIQIQNLDAANPVHIRLDASGAAVTDLRIDPGQTYSFPPGVSYTGEIRGKAVGAAVQVIAVEFEE